MSTNTKNKLLFGDLSYRLNGLLFKVHKELGRYSREKQYSDLLETKLIDNNIKYKREVLIGNTGNKADFIIEDSIILELKSKPFLLSDDYNQVKRYLYVCNFKLGILINFRSKYLQPKRILGD